MGFPQLLSKSQEHSLGCLGSYLVPNKTTAGACETVNVSAAQAIGPQNDSRTSPLGLQECPGPLTEQTHPSSTAFTSTKSHSQPTASLNGVSNNTWSWNPSHVYPSSTSTASSVITSASSRVHAGSLFHLFIVLHIFSSIPW